MKCSLGCKLAITLLPGVLYGDLVGTDCFRKSEIELLSRGELPAQFPLDLLHDCLESAFREGEHGQPQTKQLQCARRPSLETIRGNL